MSATPVLDEFVHANASRVTGRLIVGGDLDTDHPATAVRQLDELLAAGVTHILDVRLEWDDADFVGRAAPAVGYLHAGIDDVGQRVQGAWFDVVVDWARDALRIPGTRVFVHCHMGINRGPSAAFAILLDQGRSPVEALQALRASRSVAVIAYAEDALDWHHRRTGASAATRAAERRAVACWRDENPLDVAGAMRLVGGGEQTRQPAPEANGRVMIDELCERPAWLIQYSQREVEDLRAGWHAGMDYASPAFERHAEDVQPGDVTLFWQMGPKNTAGVVAIGVIADTDPEWQSHARSYQEPEGPRSLRRTQFVELFDVFDDVTVQRTELKVQPQFADRTFELFACANRPNAFRVEPHQLRYILEVLFPSAHAA